MGDYAIREFQPGDRDEYLAVYSEVMGQEGDPEWFAWKYEDNPYADHVPIFVAEYDGDLVGARSFLALDLSVGRDKYRALQPADTMITSEHRGRGLFFQMTESAIEKYRRSDYDLFFNFPNEITLPSNRKLGWETVGDVSAYYRIQNPKALVSQLQKKPFLTAGATIAKTLTDGYYWGKDRIASTAGDHTITRYSSIRSTELADIHLGVSGPEIQALKTKTFYDWRFENPDWDYIVYLAEESGELVSGMVVGTTDLAGITTTKIMDVVSSSDSLEHDDVDGLVREAIREHTETDLFVAPSSLPDSVLNAFGFYSDERPPMSYFADQTTQVVYSLTDGWEIGGVDVRESENWSLTFVEHDTS